jgi:hypothetical protein
MVGLEYADCGCVYDSSPVGWLRACDKHADEFKWHKRIKPLYSLMSEISMRVTQTQNMVKELIEKSNA